ncbi:metal ABC transporter solute-binding protein, Zn/Mn family [Miltoncostaea marina]|uniref:metal ABC transporter solute-binding protein, Zn/Mn family n=1 Tax=Miltoncostaea marina TaxID=2843215 RepID=UPI001C3CDADC|nr:zinc ABC transporter substrate-binding protein [Miltoncostaea marina]
MRRRGAGAALAALLVVVALAAAGCAAEPADPQEIAGRDMRVTATTNFITDLARQVGGDRVEVTGLMGPGVDPHLYKASARDVEALRGADVILYGGLELEGRLTDLLDELGEVQPTVAVTRAIPEAELRRPSEFEGKYDPHVWFSVPMWETTVGVVRDAFARRDPAHAAVYRRRAAAYLRELRALDREVRRRLAVVPERSRVLITSHDAFGYFGREYGFDVVAIQGTSTQTEATTADIERVAGVIAARGVRAVFVESSVPTGTIEAVLAAARRRGQEVRIGGELFADAAGDEGTPEGTYAGMVRHNAGLIAAGLGAPAARDAVRP